MDMTSMPPVSSFLCPSRNLNTSCHQDDIANYIASVEQCAPPLLRRKWHNYLSEGETRKLQLKLLDPVNILFQHVAILAFNIAARTRNSLTLQ